MPMLTKQRGPQFATSCSELQNRRMVARRRCGAHPGRETSYASTISGSRLVMKVMTSPRSGSGTVNVSSVADRQRMKAA